MSAKKGSILTYANIGIVSVHIAAFMLNLKSATPFPKCYLHKEEWTFDS